MPRLLKGVHPHLTSPVEGEGASNFEIASATPRNDKRKCLVMTEGVSGNDSRMFAVANFTESTQGSAHANHPHLNPLPLREREQVILRLLRLRLAMTEEKVPAMTIGQRLRNTTVCLR